ncbi:RNA polymerase factor sigma-54 [Halobacillus seohaensis]|uniref:RNA polymerase factor sigma-54 n=1 Tax=Halobacillus seohaensis TaxID=447421 RepID=A0ABW2EMM6_9BACI
MKLELLQKQKMVMTPELSQAITMLQFNMVEMEQFIQEHALENPLIELEENKHNITIQQDYVSSNHRSKPTSNHSETDQLDYVKNEEKGLSEHLLEQSQFLNIDETERAILRYLILNLDEKGYLSISTEETIRLLNVTEERVLSGINLLQQLEPAGIGARSLKECLLLQLRTYYPHNKLAEQLVSDSLELIADHQWKKISTSLNISLDEVNSLVNIIQSLDPKPCRNFSHAIIKYLMPDIFIDKSKGTYTISLNDRFTPTIRMNKQYSPYLKQNNETSNYLKKNYEKYLWLVKSIEQRRSTILKITEVIIDKQIDFFDKGIAFLHPLTLKEVASEIDVHESTVSRATKNKIIQTPRGTLELRMFFSSKLGSDQTNVSSAKVKTLLKQLVFSEDKKAPLSDQKISNYFSDHEGINVSRRTISKYRESLNILSSSKRKRL